MKKVIDRASSRGYFNHGWLKTHQPEKWLSGREVCALLGISIRSLQNYRDSGKLGYSQIGNKLYYKSADIERLIAECTENKKANYKSNNK